jgi:hypothetical protein
MIVAGRQERVARSFARSYADAVKFHGSALSRYRSRK